MTLTQIEEIVEYFVWRAAMNRRTDWLLKKYST